VRTKHWFAIAALVAAAQAHPTPNPNQMPSSYEPRSVIAGKSRTGKRKNQLRSARKKQSLMARKRGSR
jgi:hypothetical protein